MRTLSNAICGALVSGAVAFPMSVAATDGVIEINQTRAAVGAITAGDAPGFPIELTEPGSYILTSNLVVTAGVSGILISSSDITLDLNGFTLQGPGGTASPCHGMEADGDIAAVTVRNGVVRDWAEDGLRLLTCTQCQVVEIRATGNGDTGVVMGVDALVSDTVSSDNGFNGINVGKNSVIRSCIASSNDMRGINAGEGSTVSDCTASENGQYGIRLSDGGVIVNCSANHNDDAGISCGLGAVVQGCRAQRNAGVGISVGNQGAVLDCVSLSNDSHGINVNNGVLVRGNRVIGNGYGTGVGAGIHALVSGNRIEDNLVGSNDYGIQVDGTDNLIVRNHAVDNDTNFVIGTGNLYGTIQTTMPASPGPWDNFSR
jgi:parallel beta-helix repeat protein